MDEIVNQVARIFSEEEVQWKYENLILFKNRANELILQSKALDLHNYLDFSAKVTKMRELKKSLPEGSFFSIEEYMAYDALLEARNNIREKSREKIENFLRESYILLNEVAEYVRGGDSIIYKVVIPVRKDKKGGYLLASSGIIEDYLEVKLTMAEILKFSALDGTVLKFKAREILQAINYNEYKYYSFEKENKLTAFKNFLTRSRRGNMGQKVEAYYRFQGEKRKRNKYKISTALEETINNIIPFWQDADYEQSQIKYYNAQLITITTCINQLTSLVENIDKVLRVAGSSAEKKLLKIKFSSLDQKISDIEKEVTDEVEVKAYDLLIKQFTSGLSYQLLK